MKLVRFIGNGQSRSGRGSGDSGINVGGSKRGNVAYHFAPMHEAFPLGERAGSGDESVARGFISTDMPQTETRTQLVRNQRSKGAEMDAVERLKVWLWDRPPSRGLSFAFSSGKEQWVRP